MKLKVLGSSSKGNCYLLEGKKETLIIECGLKIATIKEGLNFDLTKVRGCIVTHEHKDHSKSVKDLLKLGINVYASAGTFKALGLSGYQAKVLKSKKQFEVGGFKILPFDVKHDAEEPVGYLITHQEMGKLLFVTDTCYCKYKFKDINHFLVEANFDKAYIQTSEIASRLVTSHMAIDTTIELLKANANKNAKTITLIHLSPVNANPIDFKKRVEEIFKIDTRIAEKGLEIELKGG